MTKIRKPLVPMVVQHTGSTLGPIISETIIAQKPRDHATNCDYVSLVCTWDHCGNFALAGTPNLPDLDIERTSGGRVADKTDVPQRQLPQRIRHNKKLRIKTGWIRYYIKG